MVKIKIKLAKLAVWMADKHTSCATFWNDVADFLITGKWRGQSDADRNH